MEIRMLNVELIIYRRLFYISFVICEVLQYIKKKSSNYKMFLQNSQVTKFLI